MSKKKKSRSGLRLNVVTSCISTTLVLVLLGAFVVTSDRPAKGKSILPDKDHSGKA